MLIVALAQLAPVLLDRNTTLAKVLKSIQDTAAEGANLIVFGEGLVPGYPWWLSITPASAWDNRIQKEIHAHYARQPVRIEQGDLKEVQYLAKK